MGIDMKSRLAVSLGHQQAVSLGQQLTVLPTACYI